SEKEKLREDLKKSFAEIQSRQETAEATEKVIRELQAWRERAARGEVVEMSPAEAKRLQWCEESYDTLREANASLR
ncbi:unnamed protein product, partial [Sphacelaria rigidula]